MNSKIYIVSDATGDTAQKVVDAALKQFAGSTTEIEVVPQVRSEEAIEDLVERAAEHDALVVHTLVGPSQRQSLQRLCREADVDDLDLIGPLMGKLAAFLGIKASEMPGGLHTIDEHYFHRIAAVEFAVNSDDGQNPRNLRRADIVLVGISRTSKTPLSTYLAQRGHKVANVPLVMGIEPPTELFGIDQDKIYGLQIQSDALFRIRQARLQALGMPADTAYGVRDHIEKEIAYSRGIFEANPHWPVIDVTDRAIEETAGELLAIKHRRDKNR